MSLIAMFQQAMREPGCDNCCIEYPMSDARFEWNPANPFTQPYEVPAGYRFAPLSPAKEGRLGFTLLQPGDTGILFSNRLSDAAVAKNRLYEIGSGVALGDIDGDGLVDIYFCRLEGGTCCIAISATGNSRILPQAPEWHAPTSSRRGPSLRTRAPWSPGGYCPRASSRHVRLHGIPEPQ